MSKYLMTLVLFVALFAQVPVHTGSVFWLYFLLLVYVLTFPSGPAQSVKRRLRNRKKREHHPCAHCQRQILKQDPLCMHCQLELSFGGHQ